MFIIQKQNNQCVGIFDTLAEAKEYASNHMKGLKVRYLKVKQVGVGV